MSVSTLVTVVRSVGYEKRDGVEWQYTSHTMLYCAGRPGTGHHVKLECTLAKQTAAVLCHQVKARYERRCTPHTWPAHQV
jgi:hypothetical protein